MKSTNYSRDIEEIDSEADHYPTRIGEGNKTQTCWHCRIVSRECRKSSYKCIACTKRYKRNFPLCSDCFGDFHMVVLPICGNARPRDMKRVYE